MSKGVILGQDTNLDKIQQQIDNIDNKFSNYLPLSGGMITGQINMSSKKITNLGTPSSGTDAVNMDYVNNAVTNVPGLKIEQLTYLGINQTEQSTTFRLSKFPIALIISFTFTSGSIGNDTLSITFNDTRKISLLDQTHSPSSVKLFLPFSRASSESNSQFSFYLPGEYGSDKNIMLNINNQTNTVLVARGKYDSNIKGTVYLNAVYY